MDQAFLEYYEEELSHIRTLATEFAALHPNVARNLSLETIPCADPYVERLLEGVAFLAARTRLKIDAESSRYVRNLIDTLYPDLGGPSPAVGLAELAPGPQVDRMMNGHSVARGTRLVSGLREGLRTRCTYTTAQAVRLWPVKVDGATYLQDRNALAQAGLSDGAIGEAQAGLQLRIAARGAAQMGALSLDRLDLFFGAGARGGAIFDAIFGFGAAAAARADRKGAVFHSIGRAQMIGPARDEGLLPRVRSSFEGYRLLREYFLMPERFHFVRLEGLRRALRDCGDTVQAVDLILPLTAPRPGLSGISKADFRLHVTPVVNLFEHECNLVEISTGRAAHPVHADRTRPKDFEIYRLLRVEDAEAEGRQAQVTPLHSIDLQGDSGHVYTTDRRPRRPDTDEVRQGQTRSSYTGDDFYISVARPAGAPKGRALRRLDIRALCTNRDLPILDDTPVLTLETGDPVGDVHLIGPMRRPRPSLRASLPSGASGEARLDDLTWRWVAQLSLDHLSLAADGADAEPLRALVQLYADRGDPALKRHGAALTRVTSRPIVERLDKPGPLAFGCGTEITLEINESTLSGGSELLLSALLARLFSHHAAINSFVRTRTRLTGDQTEVTWPTTPGTRALI